MLKSKLLGATAAAEFLAVEEVFQSWLYTGNGSTQTITNGIDLAGEGGLVWMKNRAPTGYAHSLYDTARGATYELATQSTNPQYLEAQGLTSFNSNGFSLGSRATGNGSGETYASWTFRKAPRFFDVVTYTGDGTSNRQISHNLGTEVGACIIKRTDSTGDWPVWHRSGGYNGSSHLHGVLNYSDVFDNYGYFNTSLDQSTYFTSTYFTVQSQSSVNASGGTYVAYLFAHDPLGPSGDGSDGLIACGSFATSGATDTITLGWEPQFVLWKLADATFDWQMFDSMRGMTVGDDAQLEPNTSDAELTGVNRLNPTATGFTTSTFASGLNVIYIAIRRGPMREPTSGTEVFDVEYSNQNGDGYYANLGAVTDAWLYKDKSTSSNWLMRSRLTGGNFLNTNLTNAETSQATNFWGNMNGVWPGSATASTDTNAYSWVFKRAPGFFDVVAYTGGGASLGHNLAVTPELIIVKNRGVGSWRVTNAYSNGVLYLEATNASNGTDPFQTLTPCNEATMNLSGVSQSGNNIAYLFATLPGISKVGSYTGNGSNQTINCGFTGGARFVLIKRTNSTGDWYVWDTARGIVSGNDPHLSLNTTAAEVTTDDSIDPDSSGFIVNQVAATNINVSSATYIYLAIA